MNLLYYSKIFIFTGGNLVIKDPNKSFFVFKLRELLETMKQKILKEVKGV